jgi:hypothetical protein
MSKTIDSTTKKDILRSVIEEDNTKKMEKKFRLSHTDIHLYYIFDYNS